MTYLGVDVGFKHFGLALADGPLARPLPSLKHHSLKSTAAMLSELAKDHGVGTIVLGLPEGKVATLVQALAQELSALGDFRIVLHDESLTTKDALAKLRSAGAKRAKLKNEHSYVACLILEDYLETL